MQLHVQQIGPGMVQQIQTVCVECKGQGERINPRDRCESCAGAKVVREKKTVEVHVERGEEPALPGQRAQLPGDALTGRGCSLHRHEGRTEDRIPRGGRPGA